MTPSPAPVSLDDEAVDAGPPPASLQSATLSFLVTDDELAVLLEGATDVLDALLGDAQPTTQAAVRTAVTRSLVARRALVETSDDDAALATLEPWTSLVSALVHAPVSCRVTSDGDDTGALSVQLAGDDVVSLELAPTGVNTATFTTAGTAPQVIAARIAHRDEVEQPADADGLGAPVVLSAAALAEGREALGVGELEQARELLGDAFDLLLPAGVSHLVEVIRRGKGGVTGLSVEYLDAGDLGWVAVEPAAGDDLTVRRLTDAELTPELARLFG